jgi:hypothetical protein
MGEAQLEISPAASATLRELPAIDLYFLDALYRLAFGTTVPEHAVPRARPQCAATFVPTAATPTLRDRLAAATGGRRETAQTVSGGECPLDLFARLPRDASTLISSEVGRRDRIGEVRATHIAVPRRTARVQVSDGVRTPFDGPRLILVRCKRVAREDGSRSNDEVGAQASNHLINLA